MRTPTVGRILIYTLSESDADKINRRRTTGASIAERISNNKRLVADIPPDDCIPEQWPFGAQAHIGNDCYAGQKLPLIVTAAWPENGGGVGFAGVNGQVFLDGNDTFWVKSVLEGEGEGKWQWPGRTE